ACQKSILGRIESRKAHAMFLTQPVSVGLAEDSLVLVEIAVALGNRQLSSFDHPARFAQQRGGVCGAGYHVQHRTVGEAEIAGGVATLVLTVCRAESADFLKGRDEMVIEIAADLFVGQGVRPERLGVVSGEFRILEVAGKVQYVEEFTILHGLASRLRRTAGK